MAKIENIEIDIKIGKKEYKLKNLILDTMLEKYAEYLDPDKYNNYKYLSGCFVRFDTPIENVKPENKFTYDDFDLGVFRDTTEEFISPNQILVKYIYSADDDSTLSLRTFNNVKLEDYKGKRICTLGFGIFNSETDYLIMAILDVSNYSIYVEEDQDIIISRIDKISTDAIFTSSNEAKVKGPIHLATDGIRILDTTPVWKKAHAKLTNVGLSDYPNKIEKELVFNYEVIKNIFKIKNLYSPPGPGLYPSEDLYPREDLYPDEKTYKYLVLKFKLYQDVGTNTSFSPQDTKEYYFEAIKLEKYNDIELNIKYERG